MSQFKNSFIYKTIEKTNTENELENYFLKEKLKKIHNLKLYLDDIYIIILEIH